MSFWEAIWHFYNDALFGNISSSVIAFGSLSYIIPKLYSLYQVSKDIESLSLKRKTPKIKFQEYRYWANSWAATTVLFNILSLSDYFFLFWTLRGRYQFPSYLFIKLMILFLYISSVLSVLFFGLFYMKASQASDISERLLD